MKRSTKTLTGSLAALVLSVGMLSAAPAQALDTPTVTINKQQTVTWGWEDGVSKKFRDFSEDDYDDALQIPALKVSVSIPGPGRRVILEVQDPFDRTWSTEVQTRTDVAGVALVRVNPFCENDYGNSTEWCGHDVTYRLKVLKSGMQRQVVSNAFTVTFVPTEDGMM
ncbi:unannotated protein [freshwater metagenome]|uniref:Unannotated protein n=1 Tax=freshwater metagenome TaxID=449393 RepID=A0A6J7VB21_9ZZZZ|nr:hypothetical protein [Actinomycetota bacterium]MSY52197.1 hypothetical protein [Actinomycetota bacterium]MSY87195.1 hypothetical protein [Actinomycetota bacterium]MTA50684.1 hypothetical protein [Actinomycetota bacterium]